MTQAEFRTRRLVLRQPHPDDAAAIFHTYAQDPAVCRFMNWTPHRSVRDTEAFLESCIDGWNSGSRYSWVITRAVDAAVIGMIEARVEGHRAMVGYVLARSEWSNGYVPEALQAVLEWALSQPSIFRVWAVCDVENTASARVMEKVGMTREGRLARFALHPNLSSEPRDVYCYAKTR